MAGDHEQNNTAARAEARLGIGRVALNRLRFNHESPTARMLDQSNVDRLVDVFKEVGCNNRDAEHSIPVVITRDQLHRVLQRSGLSEADLRSNDHEPPYLKLRKKEALSCLHGQHRHAAACHFFRHRPREDRWWTVTLYDRDALFTDARRDIAAGHSTSVWSFCGGEVYRHIQLATQRRDRRQRKQWKCRILTKQKRYDVRRLRHFPQYRELRDALDSLLPFRALWKGLRLGTLRRKFALRSPERLAHYVRRVHHVWSQILGGIHPDEADHKTVQELEGRCPGLSTLDLNHIKDGLETGRIFPTITQADDRARLLERLARIDTRIPSLHTWTTDSLCLTAGASILRRLFPVLQSHATLEQEAQRHHAWPGGDQPSGRCPTAVDFGSAYRQLWLFALRNAPELLSLPHGPPDDKQQALWVQVARFAWAVGFNTPAIWSLLQGDRPTLGFTADSAAGPPAMPAITTGLDARESAGRRMVRSAARCFQEARPYLWADHIYSPSPTTPGWTLTPFAIARDVFRAFFGSDRPGCEKGQMLSMLSPSISGHGYLSALRDVNIDLVPNLGADRTCADTPTGMLTAPLGSRSPSPREVSHYSRSVSGGSSHTPPPNQPGNLPDPPDELNAPIPPSSTVLIDTVLRELEHPSGSRAPAGLGLLGHSTQLTPGDVQNNLEQYRYHATGPAAVVYHYDVPPTIYQLPLLRAERQFMTAIVATNCDCWYAVYDAGLLCLLEPKDILPWLGKKLVVYGERKYWRQAQCGEFPKYAE